VPRANAVFATLKTRGILVKNLDGAHPMLADCLRVTVGAPEENARFEAALQDALACAA
jgi:histidinol-phosphate aminotransferase